MKNKILLPFFGICFAFSAFAVNADAADGIGKVSLLTGSVSAASQQSARRTLTLSDGIYEKDAIRTEVNSTVQVLFRDSTTCSLGPSTELSIEEFLFSRQKGDKGDDAAFSADLKNGSMRVNTGRITDKAPKRFKITTSVATIGIRGCVVAFNTSTNGLRLSIFEISNNGGIDVTPRHGKPTILDKPGVWFIGNRNFRRVSGIDGVKLDNRHFNLVQNPPGKSLPPPPAAGGSIAGPLYNQPPDKPNDDKRVANIAPPEVLKDDPPKEPLKPSIFPAMQVQGGIYDLWPNGTIDDRSTISFSEDLRTVTLGGVGGATSSDFADMDGYRLFIMPDGADVSIENPIKDVLSGVTDWIFGHVGLETPEETYSGCFVSQRCAALDAVQNYIGSSPNGELNLSSVGDGLAEARLSSGSVVQDIFNGGVGVGNIGLRLKKSEGTLIMKDFKLTSFDSTGTMVFNGEDSLAWDGALPKLTSKGGGITASGVGENLIGGAQTVNLAGKTTTGKITGATGSGKFNDSTGRTVDLIWATSLGSMAAGE